MNHLFTHADCVLQSLCALCFSVSRSEGWHGGEDNDTRETLPGSSERSNVCSRPERQTRERTRQQGVSLPPGLFFFLFFFFVLKTEISSVGYISSKIRQRVRLPARNGLFSYNYSALFLLHFRILLTITIFFSRLCWEQKILLLCKALYAWVLPLTITKLWHWRLFPEIPHKHKPRFCLPWASVKEGGMP